MSVSKIVRVLAAVLAAALALTACADDLHLSASGLEIGPSPAMPGDQVVASVVLIVAPVQRHTIILTIDSVEHLRVTSSEVPPLPYVITLGDAADLIAAYGTGAHSARVALRAEEANESVRTQSVSFELRQAAP